MNKINTKYSFDWLVGDIDSSIIFILQLGTEAVTSYQAADILTDGVENKPVSFGNIKNLDDFISLATIKFEDFQNKDNFIQIPLRNLKKLYDSAQALGKPAEKSISIKELQAFSIHEGNVIENGYVLYAYRINEPSEELVTIMDLASTYNSKTVSEQIDIQGTINQINYKRNKDNFQRT